MLWLKPVALYFLINNRESSSQKIKKYETQLFRYEAFVAANNLQVYSEYYDFIYDDNSFSSTGYKALLTDWNNGLFNYLLTIQSFPQLCITEASMNPPIIALDNHLNLSNLLT